MKLKGITLEIPAQRKIVFADLEFELATENRWSAVYESGCHHLVLSKILYEVFDWNWLLANQPDSLSEEERYTAAIALFVAGDRKEIPPIWREFAARLCGPGCEEHFPHSWKEQDGGANPFTDGSP